MVAHGVDEQSVTLTFLEGIGGRIARRLHDAGVLDIEDVALCKPEDLAKVRGISATRAARWIDEATKMVRIRSAFAFRETGPTIARKSKVLPSGMDLYRLRRALGLEVQRQGDGFVVSGGLEPHRVGRIDDHFACNCADFIKGHHCKHVLAVLLQEKDPELLPLVESISSKVSIEKLNLFHLWFGGGK
jgi:hypothetical protein